MYAIKEVRTRNKAKALEEAKVFADLSRFSHPNILRYYSSWLEAKAFESCNLLIYLKKYILILAKKQKISRSAHSMSNINKAIPKTAFDNKYQSFEFVLYLQMEICDSSLHEFLMNRNISEERINIEQSLWITQQLIDGLAFIHSKGFIHM